MSDESRVCPCCGEPLPEGLFTQEREVPTPQALDELARSDQATEVLAHPGGLLAVNGRSFVPVRMTLPLYWQESPVAAHVWVELPYHAGDDYLRYRDGRYRHFTASGALACDLPGFPGSLGATVQLEAHDGAELRISWCADLRVLLTGREDEFGHEDLVRLYRRLWGGDGEAAAADARLRQLARKGVDGHHDGRSYLRPVEALGPYAGIEPPQVLIRPPLDTGGEARFATLGIAEAMAGPRRVELVTAARDGGDAFERSFGEFCFWSRRQQNPPLLSGMIIPEGNGAIPTYPNLAAWLISEQVVTSEGPLCPDPQKSGGLTLYYLAAVPITRVELAFAAQQGPEALQAQLEASGLDVADLARDSCVKL